MDLPGLLAQTAIIAIPCRLGGISLITVGISIKGSHASLDQNANLLKGVSTVTQTSHGVNACVKLIRKEGTKPGNNQNQNMHNSGTNQAAAITAQK